MSDYLDYKKMRRGMDWADEQASKILDAELSGEPMTDTATPTREDVKLLPCPFCGSKPTLIISPGARLETAYQVTCVGSCGPQPSTGSYLSKDAALKAWNTRATASAPTLTMTRSELISVIEQGERNYARATTDPLKLSQEYIADALIAAGIQVKP